MMWVWFADAVLVLHLAYVAFIPLGGFLAWRWHRVVWLHLVAVAVGVVSITIGFDCPLTTWEQSLRRRGGQRPYTNGFVDHYLRGRVYPHGYEWEVQVIFAVCIVLAYALPVWRRRRIRAGGPRARQSRALGARALHDR
jgi:hypothetical protein